MIKKTVENKTSSTAYIKIPTIGVIFFSLLLAFTSFAAGVSWFKSSGTQTTSTTKINTDISSAKATFTTEKSDKPTLKFFVMSFCPYGNQIETALRPVFDLLGKKVNLQPQYILSKIDNLTEYCKQSSGDPSQCQAYITSGYFKTESECKSAIESNNQKCQDESNYFKAPNGALYSSLHGRQEATQNIREICVWNQSEDKTKWWNFVDNVNKNCTAQNADSCWSDQAKTAGLDANKITECFNNEGISLIEKEIAATEASKAYSSPTVIINGANFPPENAWTQDGTGNIAIGKELYSQAQFRSPNALKAAVCAAFKNAPSECKKTLAEVSTGTQTAGTAAAQCN